MKLYKLMRVSRAGLLHYPFAPDSSPVPVGEWQEAKDLSTEGNDGRRMSLRFRGGSRGRMKARPGFHLCTAPYAPHIGVGGTPSHHELMGSDEVWCEVEIDESRDYTSEAWKRSIEKHRKLVARDADLDYVPRHGYYWYNTNPHSTLPWVIAGEMKILRVVPDDEVRSIVESIGEKPMGRESGMFGTELTQGAALWITMLNQKEMVA